MQKEKRLMVGIDQFTLKLYCPILLRWGEIIKELIDEFIEKAGFRDIHWEISKETHGRSQKYTKAMYISSAAGSNVLIEWNQNKSDLGIRISFFAHAWAEYQYAFSKKNIDMNFWIFIRKIQCEIYHVDANRIDLTADYQNYPEDVDPDWINRELMKGALCVKDMKGRASYGENASFKVYFTEKAHSNGQAEKRGGGYAPMRSKRKLNYRIHNPNSEEATANLILKVFIEVNAKKVEKAVRENLQQTNEEVELDEKMGL